MNATPAPTPAPSVAPVATPVAAKPAPSPTPSPAMGSDTTNGIMVPAATKAGNAAKFVACIALFAVIAFAVSDTIPWYRPVGGGEDSQGIATAIFEDYVIAFEVLGLLLTASLLGAMYLAFREASE